tara:strand:- start:269 stop:442 length:174 start_codon:yes stop_codon:yes gene_type:complete
MMAEAERFFIVEADDLAKWSGESGGTKSETESMMRDHDGTRLVVIKGRVTGPVFKAE